MTPKQQATCEYLVTYRNPDGSLLLPQFGGCWHQPKSYRYTDESGDTDILIKCEKCGKGLSHRPRPNPNLFTWPNFGILWEAMQAREDWKNFARKFLCSEQRISAGVHFCPEFTHINPATFPSIVAAFLKGLER